MRPLFLLSLAFISALTRATDHPDGIEVGFDLQAAYGTIAISYPNGTLVEVGRVEGGKDYQNVMEKFSNRSNGHLAPPYRKPGDWFDDIPRQHMRRFRKWLGLPSSEDVRIISVMIKDLQEKAQDVLGFEVKSAGASVPQYPAVYDEDIADAFDYIRLDYLQIVWTNWQYTYLTYDNMAALAGHNFGLCPDIKNASTCWNGTLQDTYYIVHYTKTEVRASYVDISSMGAYTLSDSTIISHTLGSDARYETPNEDDYWMELRIILLEPLWWWRRRPSKIILAGESVKEPGFKHHLVMIMMEFFGIEVPPIFDEDPEYVDAKGVAEFLRRRKYLPEPRRPSSVSTGVRDDGRDRKGQIPMGL